ncbi:hypothetical protein F4780DRAFT_736689 [Xylariomycetidae sp. FL0641]|nr:hypothetical protein F4780DRAFT_736689 [Xylariomycetidae sp. FL0641]
MADRLSDSDPEDVFASPSKKPATEAPDRPKTPSSSTKPSASRFDNSEDAREAALRRELDGVRNINELIEGVVGTLERAKGNMQTVSNTVTTASTLLNTWTRILSQTEHNQRLILNPTWKGASADLAEAEAEAAAKQAAAERRVVEEERRRADAQRQREEEQRRREAAANAASTTVTRTRSTRGVRSTRGGVRKRAGSRPTSRVGSTASAADADSASTSTASARNVSGIGRGRGFLRSGSRGTRGY